MSVVDVEQGSAAWLTERRKGITASDSGVVCGVSPYSTARALWQLKSGRVRRVEDEPESEATAYGHRYESAIAQHYEFLTKNRVHQAKFYWHRDRSKRFGASPDGFVDDVSAAASEQQRGLLEIKAPFRRVFDYIPPEYMCQMQMQLEVCDLPWCDFVCFFAATESFRVWRVYRSRLHWRWMETKLARFLDALDNDVEPVATEFPAMFREAVELARGTMKEPPTAAMRPHLPPKVHCVDVLTARCQMAEIDWYVEKCRIELLRKEFEARATSATQPLPIHAVDVESVVVDGDDPGAGLSMIRSDFDKNMHVWNAVFATRSSPPRAEPRSVDFTPPAPLPDWLQARRSPRQSQHISVASPTRHVTTMRNAAWFRAQAPPPAILVRGALALATACVIAIVILYINV